MKCPKCGSDVNGDAAFCQGCGCNLKGTQNQVPAANVKVASAGVCSHCGQKFIPEGSSTYKLLKVISVIVGIFFGLFAFITLCIILFNGEGAAWVFALIFGAGLVALAFGKKKVRAKMDAVPCPHCGMNYKGELVGTPSAVEAQAPIPEGNTVAVSSAADDGAVLGGIKTCARCRAKNAMSNKSCDHCGFVFGKVISAIDGKKKIGLVTCPGCGSVHEVCKNKLVIVLSVLLGVASFSFFLPGVLFILNVLLGVLFFAVAILHGCGKLHALSIKKCPSCHKTHRAIFAERRRRARETKLNEKLLNRKNTSLVQFVSSLNAGMEKNVTKKNIFAYGAIIAHVIFVVMMFIPGEAEFSLMGFIGDSETVMYLDAIYNFGNPFQIITLIFSAIFSLATLFISFLPSMRLKGVSMVLGIIAGISEIVLVISHAGFRNFEWDIYEGQYSVGIVNVGLILCALIMIATVILAHMVEKEKRYQELKSK